jgi:hypothetical protein
MEQKLDLKLSTFKIVFENQILQINYDTSFKEYQTQTIDNVIQQVLDKIGPKPAVATSKDYTLICSCGRPFNPNKLISSAKCSHYFEEDYNEEKNKNEKFLLCKSEKYEKYEKYLSDNDISNLLMKATGAKEAIKISGLVPRKIENFPISDNLKNKIREYYIKKERGTKIVSKSFDLNYNETSYKELLEIGIPNNIAKAALRMSHNIREAAVDLATDNSVIWDNKDYLFFDNNEVLSNDDFKRLCKEELIKEFPQINNDEEIQNKIKIIIKRIKKENSGNNNIEDGDESEESSEEEIENSFESNSNSISNFIDLDLNFGSNNLIA